MENLWRGKGTLGKIAQQFFLNRSYLDTLMLKYHGTPISPSDKFATHMGGRNILVSYVRPNDLKRGIKFCDKVIIDNGAFSLWKTGDKINWDLFYAWLEPYHDKVEGFFIPDVIDGTERQNDKLIYDYLHTKYHSDVEMNGIPVWHVNETLDRLEALMKDFDYIAIGSAGEYSELGTDKWHNKMDKAMRVLCDENGYPKVKIHMLRCLNQKIFKMYPFYSGDSTYFAKHYRRLGAKNLLKRIHMYDSPLFYPPLKKEKEMLKRSDLHGYQNEAVQFIKDNHGCALFLGLGAGKTASSLTAMQDMYDNFEIDRFLVIAPLRVANSVWHKEADEWEHINLDFAICTGPLKNRIKAVEKNATVTVINRENIPWLVEHYKKSWPFKMIIIDESSSFKNFTSKRVRALRKVMKYTDRCVLLTATPSPNGYIDLYAQFFLLDMGARLGYTLTAYRNSYFDADFFGYTYTLKDGAMQTIESKISDIVISAKYEDLPEYASSVMTSPLSGNLLREYMKFQQEALLTVGDTELTAVNAAVLTGKLLQFCSGAVYDEDRNVHHFHDLKLDMLDEILEFNPADNLLIAYNYKHELARLQEKYPEGEVLDKEGVNIERWNNGEIKMLFVHPASAGHGIQLQHGGHILIWFGFTWSLELYEQLIGRVHRQGQKEHVNIIHLAVGEVEERLMKVISKKGVSQQNLLEALK